MSKGLEALERMKHHCAVSQEYFYEHFGEDLDIVETELKRYSKIEELCGQTIFVFNKDCINEIVEKTVDECLINENKLKALEIIKKYPHCSLQKYIGFNEMVRDGYELTQEHLFINDMPCSVEEYKIVIEVLE